MNALLLTLLLAARAEAPAEAAPDLMPKDEHAGQPLEEEPLLAPPGPEEKAQRTEALSSVLRCPVCQGLSVAASPSEAARAMRGRIEELVGLGYSDDQIVEYFVGRYGEWVLLEPKKKGFSWVLWGAPALLLGGGALALGLRAARRGSPASTAPATSGIPTSPTAGGAEEADPYRAAVLAELEGRTTTSKEARRP